MSKKIKGYSYFKLDAEDGLSYYKVNWSANKIYMTFNNIDNCGWLWLNVSKKRMLKLIRDMKPLTKNELFLELL